MSKEIEPLVDLLRNKSWFPDGVTLLFRSAALKQIRARRCRDYSTWISLKDRKLVETMDIYIDDMMVTGIINPGPIIINSPIFPFWKDKERGTIRPIFDCRDLNQRLLSKKFLLPDIKQFIQVKKATDYMVKLDLTNAYWHMQVRRSHQKYLGFKWNGQIYRWGSFPSGWYQPHISSLNS